MLTIDINDKTYDLATTLRVAYIIQGQNNHRSYIELFSEIDSMTLEQQIGIVYAAFKAANPDDATFIKPNTFLDYFLDAYNLGELMDYVTKIIEGIMGKKLKDVQEEDSESFLTGMTSSDKQSNVD